MAKAAQQPALDDEREQIAKQLREELGAEQVAEQEAAPEPEVAVAKAEPKAAVKQEPKQEETALARPTFGGKPIPQTTDQLRQLLEWSRNQKDPLPFRASWLPDEVRHALYAWSGIPLDVNPAQVLLLAGSGYVTSQGMMQAAIDHPEFAGLTSELVRSVPCSDPASGCKVGSKAQETQRTVIYKATLTVVKGDGRERHVTLEHSACPHTTFTDRLAKTAQTRAVRTVCAALLKIADPEGMDGEIIEVDPEREAAALEAAKQGQSA